MNKTLMLILLFSVIIIPNAVSFASQSDDGIVVLKNFYQYSDSRDIDAYMELFDEKYLKDTYGSNYENYILSGLNFTNITNYKIDVQYYTESQDSLTIFYRMSAKAIIDNDKKNIENDLVAFFTRTDDGPKLRYIILQDTYIETMNTEIMLESIILADSQESIYLKSDEAKKIDSSNSMIISGKNNLRFFWITLIFTIVIIVYFKERIFSKRFNSKISKFIEKTKKKFIQFYEKLFEL